MSLLSCLARHDDPLPPPVPSSTAASSSGPVPPPPAPAVGGRRARGPRVARSEKWPAQGLSCWQIASIAGGGWGGTCKRHNDVGDDPRTVCKIALTSSGLTDAEARLRVMGWLVEGITISDTRPDARTAHVKGVRPRKLPLKSETELERTATAFWDAGGL